MQATLADRAASLGYNAQRIPAWCDRILHASWVPSLVTPTEYRAEPGVDTSDHTPVCATFVLRVMLPSDDDLLTDSGSDCARARAGEAGGVEASVSGAGAS